MMVGRPVDLEVDKAPPTPGEPVLEIAGLSVADDRGHAAVRDLNLVVRAGEIVAVAGVQGNGQTELVEAITGLRRTAAGSIRIDGREIKADPRRVFEAGVAHVPEDRLEEGLIPAFTIAENMVLNTYYLKPYADGLRLHRDAILATATELAKQYDVRTPSVFNEVANLSGGNQQKVIVAREFTRPIKLLVAAQPTRGLDVGSIEYIHRRVVEKRDEGTAVLIVSTELDEVLALGDRIAVMYQGRIVAILDPSEATPERLGLYMGGAEVAPEHADDDDPSLSQRYRGTVPRRRGSSHERHDQRRPRRRAGRARRARRRATEPRWLRRLPGQLVLPFLAVFTAMLIGAFVIVLSDPALLALWTTDPLKAAAESVRAVLEGYGALITGALGSPSDYIAGLRVGRHRADQAGVPADQRDDPRGDAADLHRPRGGPRVPQRPVQHRGRGPAVPRRDRRHLRRLLAPRAAAVHPPAADDRRRVPRRGAVGLHPGHPQGADRRPRGDRHDHAQLHRLPAGDVGAAAAVLPAPRPERSRSRRSWTRPPSSRRSSTGCG